MAKMIGGRIGAQRKRCKTRAYKTVLSHRLRSGSVTAATTTYRGNKPVADVIGVHG